MATASTFTPCAQVHAEQITGQKVKSSPHLSQQHLQVDAEEEERRRGDLLL